MRLRDGVGEGSVRIHERQRDAGLDRRAAVRGSPHRLLLPENALEHIHARIGGEQIQR